MQTSLNSHNDPINNANSILSVVDLPEVDTVIRNRNFHLTTDKKKLFNGIVTLERLVGGDG